MPLSPADETWLSIRGISAEEAHRQIRLLSEGTLPPILERAARIGDGIARLSLLQRDHWTRRAHETGSRLGFFVPASGAASRMFASLRELSKDPIRLASHLPTRYLMSVPVVERAMKAAGLDPADTSGNVLKMLAPQSEGGLGWPDLPKAFLPFHAPGKEGVRTAFEEQIHETCDILGPGNSGYLHLTLGAELIGKALELQELAGEISRQRECQLDLLITAQEPSTDTLAMREDGEVARNANGKPLLRAGGHGSLLFNLSLTPGDVVLVKNIDNIQPRWRQGVIVPWRLALAGISLELRKRCNTLLQSTFGSDEETRASKELRDFLHEFGRKEELDTPALRLLADRPVRVAGMVRNDGAPGGGPFWVEGKGLQIVEQSEVSKDKPQREIMHNSTHFNPVEMACCLRRPNGRMYDLERFRDASRAFISNKPDALNGPIRVLEHPGLWNGTMGDWLTLFVEIPPETFLPAKTIYDLAHPWRQPPGDF
jgi:Domain of unknown function (DUF4301)